ncbi:MAG: MsnO8 family LLM class oxidoreductase, partial [Gammaproteobacteria bacterium]
MRIGVLDQSPVHDGGTTVTALACSTELAQTCEAWGYHRYWVAEHHDLTGFAGTCPEILIAHIAELTREIRVGSGGVMLSHYSPFKVAEQFRLLEALYPGRIDLGIGRAPGGDARAIAALAFPHEPPSHDLYAHQAQDLCRFLHETMPADHVYAELRAMPAPAGVPQVWQLGSGGGSAEFAGSLGMGFALALFIGNYQGPPDIVAHYRRAFRPSPSRPLPATALAVACVCANSREEARLIAMTQAYWRLNAFRYGRTAPLLPPETCLARVQDMSSADRAFFNDTLDKVVFGTPAQ